MAAAAASLSSQIFLERCIVLPPAATLLLIGEGTAWRVTQSTTRTLHKKVTEHTAKLSVDVQCGAIPVEFVSPCIATRFDSILENKVAEDPTNRDES